MRQRGWELRARFVFNMAAPSLGKELCRVAGAVRYSSVNSVCTFAKPGYLSLQRLGSESFYLVMVVNVPRGVKKVKLLKQQFSVSFRDQHLTVAITGSGGVHISVRDANHQELEAFRHCLEEFKATGTVGRSSGSANNADDIENQPLNRNLAKNKPRTPARKSPTLARTPARPPPGSLAAVIMKPSSSPRQVGLGSGKKQTRKAPLHEIRRDTNTVCDSSGPKHSASSFYNAGQTSRSPQSWTAKSSPKQEPSSKAEKKFKSFKSRSEAFLEEETALTGFSNLGNTCYMNSILQSLLGLTSFSQDIDNENLLKKVSPTSLYKSLHSLLAVKVAGGSATDLRPKLRRVKEAISTAAARFSGHMQHDAQEFLCQVLDQIKDDVGSDAELDCPVSRNFEARVIHKMCCKRCGFSASTEEMLHGLSLQSSPFSHESGAVSLDKLIRAYFEDEEIEFSCEKCSHTTAISTHRFTKLPRVLILHLQRSDFDKSTEQQAKRKYRVSLPQHIGIDGLCVEQVKPPAALNRKHGRKGVTGKAPHLNNAIPEVHSTGKENNRTPQARRRLKPSFCSSVFGRSLQKTKRGTEPETIVLSDSSTKGGTEPETIVLSDGGTKRGTEPETFVLSDSSIEGAGSPNRNRTDADKLDSVRRVCGMSEEDQIKHVLELSAKEAEIAQGQRSLENEEGYLEFAMALSAKEAEESQRQKSPERKGENLEFAMEFNAKETEESKSQKSLEGEKYLEFGMGLSAEEAGESQRKKSLESKEDSSECTLGLIASEAENVSGLNSQENEPEQPVKGKDNETSLKRKWTDGELEQELNCEGGKAEEELLKLSAESEHQNDPPQREKTTSIVFATRNPRQHDKADTEEFGLRGGVGLNSKDPPSSDSRDPFLAGYQRVMNDFNLEMPSEGSRLDTTPQKSNEAHTTPRNCSDDVKTPRRSGPSKRSVEQLSNVDSKNDTDDDFQLKRRRTYGCSWKGRKGGAYAGSPMSRKPTLSKFEGDLCVSTPVKPARTLSTRDDEAAKNAATPTWNGTGAADFSEDDIAKAIELSLQDQNGDEELTQALERSVTEFTYDVSMDQEQLIPEADMSSSETDAVKQEHCYELVSVVSHFGSSSESGHYISDVYDCKAEQWTSYDDSTATKVNEHTVRFGRARTAYISFYLHRQCVQAIKQAI